MKTTVTRKVGLNRGKKRIWIEGKLLIEAGFLSGLKLTATVKNQVLTLAIDANGERKVSGKVKPDGSPNPIIDLTGAMIADLVGDAELVSVTFETGIITIKPI